MKVRCIRTSLVKANLGIVNANLRGYLELGADYVVYGIRVSPEMNYYMIFNDGHLMEVPFLLFELVDATVSPLWQLRYSKGNEMTFWPELFYQEHFFENFSEYEVLERQSFEKLQKFFISPVSKYTAFLEQIRALLEQAQRLRGKDRMLCVEEILDTILIDVSIQDERLDAILTDIAYILDFYSPQMAVKRDKPEYYGDEQLEKELKLAILRLDEYE